MMKQIGFTLIIALAFVSSAYGQKVHLKTGNFSVKHTDIELPDKKMNVDRVYNSTSKYKSIFGIGWAYEYSKVLVVNPDGSIVTKECECEGRTDNVYQPTTFDETAKSEAINKITAAVQLISAMNPEEIFNYKSKLTNNRSFFIDEWKKLLDQKKMEQYQVPLGTKYISKSWGFAVITKTQEGYEMNSGSTKKYYNNNGIIIREVNGKDWLKFEYNSQSQLIKINNHLKNSLLFEYNNNGFVSEIKSLSNTPFKATYVYDGDKLMSIKSNFEKKQFQYLYSNDENKLLVQFKKDDTNICNIFYTNEDDYKVKYFTNNKSDSTHYTYSRRTTNEREYIREGSEINFENNNDDEDEEDDSSSNKKNIQKIDWKKKKEKNVIYFINTLPDGFHYNYKTITNDGRKTEDVYNNEEGDPDKIIVNNDTTFFTYNRFGSIILKESETRKEELQYDENCNKMISYKKIEKKYNEENWSHFNYNINCELDKVENSDGDKISLVYNNEGKIAAMTDLNENKSLSFKYNEIGKPIRIDGPNGGIKIKYSKFGEIDKVESEQGSKMALEVTQMFQKLLKLIKIDNLIPCKCRL